MTITMTNRPGPADKPAARKHLVLAHRSAW